jgi:phage replication initiation protein
MNLPNDDEIPVEGTNARVASVGASTDLPPRVVTRGETHVAEGNTSATAFVDWLGFTVGLPAGQRRQWLEDAVETVFCVPRRGWSDTGKGWYGYKHRINLGPFGLLAFGGDAQRGTYHVELNGHGCRAIHDWNAARLWGETYAANVTRLDLAHDDLGAYAVSVAKALSWLADGLFTTSGRPPKAELWDDLGSGRGKTLYVGSRGAGKLLRVYEKGKQLGDPVSPWVRAEVELRNKGRVVPWGAVTGAASYFAGAYPVLGFLSTEQIRLRTIQRGGQISYDAMVNTLRRQGGKALGVMCQVHQGDAAGVLARVVREGLPKRLQSFGDVIGQIAAESAP